MTVTYCNACGMFSMAKTKPESRKAGRKVLTSDICAASIWPPATIDNNAPCNITTTNSIFIRI